MEEYPEFNRNPRRPSELPPPLTCDSQVHFYRKGYPIAASATYKAPDATFEDVLKMHQTLGIERGVLVQPVTYGTDHGLLIELLQGAGGRYRGIAIPNHSATDKDLQRLHDAGVRGVRFTFRGLFGDKFDASMFERFVARIAPMGWTVKVHIGPDEITDLAPMFRRVRIPAMIDHIGQTKMSRGLDQPSFKVLLELIKQENWWMMLANGDRNSVTGYPWLDSVPFAQAVIAVAPDRVVWGTDWPHVSYMQTMPNDAELLELAYQYAPDAASRQRLFVDNPARFFDFPR